MATESSLPPNLYNCASGICCDSLRAAAARIEILCSLGCPHDLARIIGRAMADGGVAFAPQSLMDEIARLADHPGRR